MARAGLRAAAVGLAALTLVALAGSPAAAHNELIASTPEDGAVLEAAPAVVELEFTEQIDQRFARVAVTDVAGGVVPSPPARVQGTKVIQRLSLPEPGQYRVGFRVVSTDGHPVEDSIAFTVRSAPSHPASATPAGSPDDTAGAGGAEDHAGAGGPPGWAPVAGLFGVLVIAAAGLLAGTRRRAPSEEQSDGESSR